jgi:hypothetical protein
LALGLAISATCLWADDPPVDLARRTALRETESEAVRANYAYRQQVLIEEFGKNNTVAGQYREVREVIFSPQLERSETVVGKPFQSLQRLQMTDEDFRDLREIQPLLLTKDRLRLYHTKPRGDEEMDGTACWVLEVKPRQILQDQRLFEGLLWISKSDFSVVRAQGRALPQMLSTKSENLFPHFTTLRQRMDNGFWFPVATVADDTLPFSSGPIRMRMKVQYTNYQRFGADSTIKYETPR